MQENSIVYITFENVEYNWISSKCMVMDVTFLFYTRTYALALTKKRTHTVMEEEKLLYTRCRK